MVVIRRNHGGRQARVKHFFRQSPNTFFKSVQRAGFSVNWTIWLPAELNNRIDMPGFMAKEIPRRKNDAYQKNNTQVTDGSSTERRRDFRLNLVDLAQTIDPGKVALGVVITDQHRGFLVIFHQAVLEGFPRCHPRGV